jgi:hypothetical protein
VPLKPAAASAEKGDPPARASIATPRWPFAPLLPHLSSPSLPAQGGEGGQGLVVNDCDSPTHRTHGDPSVPIGLVRPHVRDGPRGGLQSNRGLVAEKGDSARIDFITKRQYE